MESEKGVKDNWSDTDCESEIIESGGNGFMSFLSSIFWRNNNRIYHWFEDEAGNTKIAHTQDVEYDDSVTMANQQKKKTGYKRLSKLKKDDGGAARAIKGLHFIANSKGTDEEWRQVETKFDELAVDSVLPKSHFGQCIGIESQEFAAALFDALARPRGITSAAITKPDLREFWLQLVDQRFETRLQTFFDLMDRDADGRITEEEVKEIIILSASANRLSTIKDSANEYAALFMEELDPYNHGYIKLQNLQILLQAPDDAMPLTPTSHFSQLTGLNLFSTIEQNPIKRWYKQLSFFFKDNKKQIWVLALWFTTCIALFIWKFIQFKHRSSFKVLGYCVSIAKGGAELTKFNMALILLSMCRKSLTWLRNKTNLGVVIPFDDNINFHKVIAVGIAVGIGLHAVPHLTCNLPRLLHATDEEYEPMKPFFGDPRPPNYWWFVKGREGWTGVLMIMLMAIAVIWAQPWFRMNKLRLPKPYDKFTGFNAFWYLHHLLILVYVLFVFHGTLLYLSKEWYKNTAWMYVAIPMLWYGCERLIQAFWSRYRTVMIEQVSVYPDVLALQMIKPKRFKYRSGQYIFVKCTSISLFEWHPFSITSAPGDAHLSICIRKSGDWTSQLKDLFSKVPETASVHQKYILNGETMEENSIPRYPEISIDGPYGAPSQDYMNYKVLLLIGLGIGVTPMISIVKDLLHKIKQQRRDLEEGNADNAKATFSITRAYFYWVTPEATSFEWFKDVLSEVTDYGLERLIQVHYHCSRMYEEGNAQSALITMLQSFHHAKNGVDIVSGTNVKTHFAKPDWHKVFKGIAHDNADGEVGVFYCGTSRLVGDLRQLATNFSKNTSTRFDFHKENF